MAQSKSKVGSLVGGRLNDLYSTEFLPNYMRNMLLLYGISEVEHLTDFDGEAINTLLDDIRTGRLTGTFVDISSKQEQMKYFGAPVVNFEGFNFRSRELHMLERLAPAATEFIKAESGRASKQHRKKRLQPNGLNFSSSSESLKSRDSALGKGLPRSYG